MLHKKRVLLTLYGNARRQARIFLRLKARQWQPPVLSQPLESVVDRHGWIARAVQQHMPAGYDFKGKAVCEVGSGDCLAAAALFLGLGARHVDMIEVDPPVVNDKQAAVLGKLKDQGLPVDLTVIKPGNPMQLDSSRISYHRTYMENYESANAHDFIFSFSVVEHVEDLPSFYASCWKTLKPGGWMLHVVDLGGHHLFEDPLPPLDFQTYSDSLFGAMYPRYHRATRRPLAEHLVEARKPGFRLEPVQVRRKADTAYLDEIWPKLRPTMRAQPKEDVAVIEFALLAQKP